MSKKKNENQNSSVPDNLVRFPGASMPDMTTDTDDQLGMPEFLGFYLPRALEYASLTAEEAQRLIEEFIDDDPDELNDIVDIANPISRADRQKLRQDPRLACELLDIILVKIQGLSLIIPPPEVILPLIPEMEEVEGFANLHEMAETCGGIIEDIMTAVITESGAWLWEPTNKIPKIKALKSKKTEAALEQADDLMDMICDALDEALHIFYEIADE